MFPLRILRIPIPDRKKQSNNLKMPEETSKPSSKEKLNSWDDLFVPFGECDFLVTSEAMTRSDRFKSARKLQLESKKEMAIPRSRFVKNQCHYRTSIDATQEHVIPSTDKERTMRIQDRPKSSARRFSLIESKSKNHPNDTTPKGPKHDFELLSQQWSFQGNDSLSNWSAGTHTESTADLTNSTSTFGSLSPFASPHNRRHHSLDALREAALEEFGVHVRRPVSTLSRHREMVTINNDSKTEMKVSYPKLRPLRDTKSEKTTRPSHSTCYALDSLEISNRTQMGLNRSKSLSEESKPLPSRLLRRGRRSSVQRSLSNDAVDTRPTSRRFSTSETSSVRRTERRQSFIRDMCCTDANNEDDEGSHHVEELVCPTSESGSFASQRASRPSLRDIFACNAADIDVFDLVSHAT